MNSSEISSFDCSLIYQEYYDRLLKYAVRYVRDHMAAEDIVADSFVSLINARDSFDGNSNIPAYIFTIVRNNCLQWLRAQKRHFEIEQNILSSQKTVIRESIRALENNDINKLFSKEIEDIVARTLETMPELTNRVFVSHRYLGMSYNQIAGESNISEIKVDTEMRKALKILRVALKDFVCLVLPII